MALRFSSVLAEARTAHQLSQTDLAKRAAVAQSMVAALESGTRRPSEQMLKRLADALGLEGTERDRFVLLGLLLHWPTKLHRYVTIP